MSLSQPQRRAVGPSNPELELLLDVVSESLCGLDAAGNVTFCNSALLALIQYRAEELIGCSFDAVLRRRSPDETASPSGESPPGKAFDPRDALHPVDHLLWRKDGTCFPARYCSRPLQLPSSGTEYVLTIRDLTERRCAEEQLRRSHDCLAESQRLTHIGSWSWRTNQREWVFWSDEHYRIFGREPGSGRMGFEQSMEQLHPDDAPIFHTLVRESIATRKGFETDLRIILPDGSIRRVHGLGRPIVDEKGDVVEFVGTTIDVTDRRRAERELRLAQFSLEHASDAVAWTDPAGRLLYVNQAYCDLFEGTREELLRLSIPDLSPRMTIERWNTFWPDLKAQGATYLETDCISRRGRVFPVDVNVTCLQFDGEEYAFAFVCDISERKRVEQRLRKLSGAVEQSPAIVIITDAQGTIEYVNPKFSKVTGYSAEEAIGQNPRLLKSGLQSAELYRDLWTTIQAGREWRGELANRNKQGDIYWESATIVPISDSSGVITHFLALKEDITERRRVEKKLQESDELKKLVLESIPEAVYGIDLDGNCTFCNPSCLALLGFDQPEELYGKNMHDVMHHSRADGTPYPVEECHIFEAFRCGRGTHIDNEVIWRRDGTSFPAEYWSRPILRDGMPIGTVVTFVNITKRKQAEQALRESEMRYRLLFERNLAGVFRTTLQGRILECNQAAAQMFGCASAQEIVDTSIADVYQAIADRDELLRKLKRERYVTSYEVRYRRKDGEPAWAMLNATMVPDDRGADGFIEGTFVDITKRKMAEEQIQSLAYFDTLTGLPNRTLLRDRLSLALAGARRKGCRVALFFLDLDRFKNVNDSLGHSVGDLLLKGVAQRLKEWGREQDTIARLGGDEFVVVVNDIKCVADAAVAAQRLLDALDDEMLIQRHSLSVRCSIGISIFPEHGEDSETLIKHADAAMYTAKDRGRHNFQFFTSDMNAQAVARLNLENRLRTAIDRKELFLMYQPQMDLASGKIVGLEALLRWQNPELGLVPPGDFIRIAENSGLIIPIGEWVLRTACAQARQWQDEGLGAVSVAVNVSAVQFRQEGFPQFVRQVLLSTGLDPQYLELEVTESLLVSIADTTFSVLRELKDMGLSLAIDDFGTGYSSLSYLKRFPVSRLKIDSSFIRDVALDPDDAAITTAIIHMAKSLNLKVIAEGVECEAQMAFLRAHHCDEIQGYFFSVPLTADQAADRLRADGAQPPASVPPVKTTDNYFPVPPSDITQRLLQ